MSSKTKIVLTTSQIIEAHAAHGNDFVQINFESLRKYKNFAQYIDIDIKLADGSVNGVRYWKLSNDGIMVGSHIRKPDQRKYESIRLGVALADEQGIENENVKALQLLCVAFEENLLELKNNNKITDDARAPRKQADGKYLPIHLISTKVVTPMQTVAKSKETGDLVDLDNPYFWLSIGKKKFFNNGEQEKPSTHFEDRYYADENGQPDLERPIMTHEYAPTFYNVDDSYHHRRTGNLIYKLLGAYDDDNTDDCRLDNTNIQDYLTKGSALMGNFKFEMAVSGRQCKLDVALYGKFYVKVADKIDGGAGQDDESITAFSGRYASIGGGKCDDASVPSPAAVDEYDDE